MKKQLKYLIFDLDGTLIDSHGNNSKKIQNYIDKNIPEYSANSKYVLKNIYRYSNVSKILSEIMNKEEYKKHTEGIKNALDSGELNTVFFPGAIELIKKLSKKYDLYLSTGSPEHILEKRLISGCILDLFKITKGSAFIPKSVKHIEIFKDYSEDPEFEKYALVIGDGDSDKFIAESSGIDFVRVGEGALEGEVHIQEISELENILRERYEY